MDCSRYKPPVPIIAVSRYDQVARQLHLYRGVFPLVYPKMDREPDWTADLDTRIDFGINVGKARGFIHPGDIVVIITGWRTGLFIFSKKKSLKMLKIGGAGSTNTIRVKQVPQ